MPPARRTDANQAQIARGLRKLGLSVFSTHGVGRGFPDLVVLNPISGCLMLLEVKSPSGKRTPGQKQFAEQFEGAVAIVHDVAEAACAVGIGALPW